MAHPGNATASGAGQIQSSMERLQLDNTTAKIRIETGDIKDCGTNAQVYVTIYGDKGNTGEISLGQPDGGYFEQGVTSVFG
ncbi:lipoxygenase homology domain-containing protein 1-like, partial [Saccoglossus kowalevskii]